MEYFHIGEPSTTGTQNELISFMEGKGYTVRAKVTHWSDLAGDYIFVKKGIQGRHQVRRYSRLIIGVSLSYH